MIMIRYIIFIKKSPSTSKSTSLLFFSLDTTLSTSIQTLGPSLAHKLKFTMDLCLKVPEWQLQHTWWWWPQYWWPESSSTTAWSPSWRKETNLQMDQDKPSSFRGNRTIRKRTTTFLLQHPLLGLQFWSYVHLQQRSHWFLWNPLMIGGECLWLDATWQPVSKCQSFWHWR